MSGAKDAALLQDFDLVAAAAHELKTPLTIISGTASMIRDGYVTDKDTTNEYLDRIMVSSERLLNTIDSLIDLSKTSHQGDLHLENVPVSRVVENVVMELGPMLSARKQEVQTKLSSHAQHLFAESHLLHRALFNIVENASKYSKDGSIISLSVHKSKKNICFEVRDKGVGLKKSDISKLFRAFGQIKQPIASRAGSNGLGLYVSQVIAGAHGGRITASPCKGGSLFRLELPIVHQLTLFSETA